MRKLLVNILFRLLGEGDTKLFELLSLFNPERRKEADKRKKFWKQGLQQAYQNKGLLDFLYYQSESDKERYWRGKSNSDFVQGTRVRTLWLVHQMRMAVEEEEHQETAEAERKHKGFINKIQQEFKQLTGI